MLAAHTQVVPKPDRAAQAQEPGAKQVLASDLFTVGKKPLWKREWNSTDLQYTAFLGGMHLLALAAPFTFSWEMVGMVLVEGGWRRQGSGWGSALAALCADPWAGPGRAMFGVKVTGSLTAMPQACLTSLPPRPCCPSPVPCRWACSL